MSTVTPGFTTTVSPNPQFVGSDVQVGGAGDRVAFYGGNPVAQAQIAAAASDPASTQALANSIRTILINAGLVRD